MIDVAGAVINGNFLAITEQIGLKDIAEDFSGWFTFRVGPGWKVTVDGQERGLTVRYQEGELVEYHPVDALEITGRAVIGVSEVSLTHKRLGDVTPYAYGEARIEGRPALIVITENAAGGKASIRFQEERSEAR